MAIIRWSTELSSGQISNLYVYESRYCSCNAALNGEAKEIHDCTCGLDKRFLQLDTKHEGRLSSCYISIEEAVYLAKEVIKEYDNNHYSNLREMQQTDIA